MFYYVDVPTSDNRPSSSDSSSDITIIFAPGVACAVVMLVIITIVLSIIIYCKKKLGNQLINENIYDDIPLHHPSKDTSGVFINPVSELNTIDTRAMTTNFDNQEHQA